MNKAMNKIYILVATATVFMFAATPALAVDDLVVQFQQDPLFDNANFLPGDDVTRYIDVENTYSITQPIGIEAINVNNSDSLGDVIDFVIAEEGGSEIYSGTLTDFLDAGEIFLSNLGAGDSTRYNFTATFRPETGNSYQNKTLEFDLVIGVTTETEPSPTPSVTPTPTPEPSQGPTSVGGGGAVILLPTPAPSVTPTPEVAGASVTPTPKVAGTSTMLPETGLSGIDKTLLLVFATLVLIGIILSVIGYAPVLRRILKKLDQ